MSIHPLTNVEVSAHPVLRTATSQHLAKSPLSHTSALAAHAQVKAGSVTVHVSGL
eukprot:CAMPEP_0185161580 /NCGR_PEP_ID=MMETSP1139-20130426/5194_1 /TAXON_ID=298111 /ORGANISM="Pavlova sp., Strain CCMP459" /LENGTH=54 /DNA_ID=CAMNT_0027726853 /DNA_START=8 /DNA_END=169 /DNA_ORIENTATION=+